MIADHVYVFFTFFGPDLVEKLEDKRRSIFARASAILLTVDITHMRILTPDAGTVHDDCEALM